MYQVSKQNVELEMESPSVRPVRPVIPYSVHILLTDSVAMGHPLAMNPVALVSDLSAQNTTFLIVLSWSKRLECFAKQDQGRARQSS